MLFETKYGVFPFPCENNQTQVEHIFLTLSDPRCSFWLSKEEKINLQKKETT